MIDDSIPEDHRALWMGLMMTALVMGGLYAAYNGDFEAIKQEIAVIRANDDQVAISTSRYNAQPAALVEVMAPHLIIPQAIFQLDLPAPKPLR